MSEFSQFETLKPDNLEFSSDISTGGNSSDIPIEPGEPQLARLPANFTRTDDGSFMKFENGFAYHLDKEKWLWRKLDRDEAIERCQLNANDEEIILKYLTLTNYFENYD